MTSFKDRSWSTRYGAMGDEAEAVFEATYRQKFERYGFNRPSFGMARLPPFIRYTPDYATAKGLVEVQGFGRDQTFKLKEDKLAALEEWHLKFRVDFFVWDSFNKRFGWMRLPELTTAASDSGTWDIFPEGKSYVAIKADALPAEWTDYTP